MKFAAPFADGPGDDFAILTGDLWGPLATTTRFEFFLDNVIQTAFDTTLAPNHLFRFDLPGILANRVRVTNVSPDPPGVNNLANMSFRHAGVTTPITPVPEPTSLVLLGSGLGAIAARRLRRRN